MNTTLNNLEWAAPILYLNGPSGILFPKRDVTSISTGGLLELLRTRGLFYLTALLVVIAAILLIVPRLPKPPVITPTATPGRADLVVSRLSYTPPHPAPGQEVIVRMTISNIGDDRAGPFQVAWYADTQTSQDKPTIVINEEGGLSPGNQVPVLGYYIFPWWGTFSTQAQVNFENLTPESNYANDLKGLPLTIGADRQLTTDFSVLPNDTQIDQPRTLKGDEFSAWGLHIAPDMTVSSACAGTAAQIDPQTEGGNNLLVGGSGVSISDLCGVIFTTDQPIGGAKIDFVAASSGTYTLELHDSKDALVGKPISKTTLPGAASINLALPGSDIHKAVIRGPGTLTIQRLYLAFPNAPVLTPTPTPSS